MALFHHPAQTWYLDDGLMCGTTMKLWMSSYYAIRIAIVGRHLERVDLRQRRLLLLLSSPQIFRRLLIPLLRTHCLPRPYSIYTTTAHAPLPSITGFQSIIQYSVPSFHYRLHQRSQSSIISLLSSQRTVQWLICAMSKVPQPQRWLFVVAHDWFVLNAVSFLVERSSLLLREF